jgi:ISXO2-like transposase domain
MESSLFLMHRIRFAMGDDRAVKPKLSGIVEADETYVGGKPRYKQPGKGPQKGWLQTRKTPVVSLVERDGNIRSFVTADVTSNNLARILRENIAADAHLMTDSSVVYRSHVIRSPFARHSMTNHRQGEYARPGGIHSNTVESSFSLLKRGIYGTFHNVSRKHLHRYVAEFIFDTTRGRSKTASARRLRFATPMGSV